jgi:hypothetical protein
VWGGTLVPPSSPEGALSFVDGAVWPPCRAGRERAARESVWRESVWWCWCGCWCGCWRVRVVGEGGPRTLVPPSLPAEGALPLELAGAAGPFCRPGRERVRAAARAWGGVGGWGVEECPSPTRVDPHGRTPCDGGVIGCLNILTWMYRTGHQQHYS